MEILFNILHVAAAVFIVGPMAVLPHSGPRMLREGRGAQAIALAKTVSLFSWLSLIVVIFGFGVMGMSDPKHHVSFDDTWIWLSVVFYVIALLISLLVVVPALRRAGTAVESGAGAGSTGAIAAGGGLVTLLLIAVVVLMVWKP